MNLQQQQPHQFGGGGLIGSPIGGQLHVKTNGSCLIISVVIALFMVGMGFFMSTVFPDMFKGIFKGHLVDAVYVPDGSGSGKLFYRIDNSFYYTSKVSTPGTISISTESLFNKTTDYLYDPVEKTVIRETLKEYPSTPPQARFFYVRNGVWAVTSTLTGDFDGDIQVIDPESGNEIMNMQAFMARFPELKFGIAELSIQDTAGEPVNFSIKTRDGLDLYYYLEEDKIFATITDYHKFMQEKAPANITVFALTFDGSRGELFKVTGPPDQLLQASFSSGSLKDPETVKFFYNAEAERLTPDKVYLEALILYEDEELAVILHQDQIGENADRLLTGIDIDGTVLWTLPQSELFPELRITEDDPFSSTFFMKSEMSAKREGDLLLFRLKDVGIMGIDLKTGAKRWEFRI